MEVVLRKVLCVERDKDGKCWMFREVPKEVLGVVLVARCKGFLALREVLRC